MFYIYGLYDQQTNKLLYIGKGKNARSKIHRQLLVDGKHPNPKLQNKFNLLLKNSSDIIDLIIEDGLSENEAFQKEIELISFCGIENLCNLTLGGSGGDCITNHPDRDLIIKKSATSRIGLHPSEQTRNKIRLKRIAWQQTEEYKQFIQCMSHNRTGENNPMYGYIENEEKKRQRMKNLLDKPRWNKGLTKDTDPRIKKLAVWKNKLPPNAKRVKIIEIDSNKILEFQSIKNFIEYIKHKINKCNTKKVFKLLKQEIDIYENWKLAEI
jgi:hypothetical protein